MQSRITSALFAMMACMIVDPGWACAQDRNAATSASASVNQPAYKLGAGDKVRIIVFGEDSLTGEFFVSGGGAIAFPLIGGVTAAGMIVPELQAAITTKLADGYLNLPQVSVEVLNYRPFLILGEVMKPSEYPFTNGLTVMNAVATASGFTYRADTKRVHIKPAAASGENQVPLTAATAVSPGDTIRIDQRSF